jgi:hypothetical protein
MLSPVSNCYSFSLVKTPYFFCVSAGVVPGLTGSHYGFPLLKADVNLATILSGIGAMGDKQNGSY